MTSLKDLDLSYTAIPRSLARIIRSKLPNLERLDGYPEETNEPVYVVTQQIRYEEELEEKQNDNLSGRVEEQLKYIEDLQREVDKRDESIAAIQNEINGIDRKVQAMEKQEKDGKMYMELYKYYTLLSELRKQKDSVEQEKFKLMHVQRTEQKRLGDLRS